MSEERKQPTAGVWITVALVAVLVGYPLSFGPACWLIEDHYLSPGLVARIYRPLLQVVKREQALPESMPRTLTSWALFGSRNNMLRISGLTQAQFSDQFERKKR
jgi:hypothetical protein